MVTLHRTCTLTAASLLALLACTDVRELTAPAHVDPSPAAAVVCGEGPPCGRGAPPPRGYPLMAHDPVEDRLYVFGGFYDFGFDSEIFDVWEFTPRSRTWRQVAGELPPKNGDQLALDVQSRRVIYFQPYVDPVETWAFDIETGAWENRQPILQPPPRWGAKMVYDVESDRAILYGGAHFNTTELLGDTWAYDYESNTWTELTPASSPPPYHFVDMVYVPTIDRIVMFGGIAVAWDSGVLHNETWSFDYNTNEWANLAPASPPSPRVYHSLAFEAGSNSIVMFGGVFDESNWPDEEPIDETWIYSVGGNRWSQVTPAHTPGARAWHATAGTARTTVLFGGGERRSAYTNDTFLYDTRSNVWIRVPQRGSH